MDKNSKIGILKYIARTKGIKFEDDPQIWYNPTDEAKEMVKEEYVGKQVEIVFEEGKQGKFPKFASMVLLESEKPKKEPQEQIEEETVEEEPEEEKANSEPKKSQEEPEKEEEEPSDYTKQAYADMEQTKLETAKKGPHKLTYASWAEAWGALKRKHPTANHYVHEDKNGMPLFYDEQFPAMGAFVKVSVTVMGLTHTVHLPVMDHSNKSISMDKITTFDINKNIQRALAKAIALHGIGLYVFRGEDIPKE